MKISDLNAGMNNIALKATIKEMREPREVMTKFGYATVLTEATLEDETGSILLILWGKQSEGLKEGDEVEIKNGFVKEFREVLQLGVGKGGSITVVG